MARTRAVQRATLVEWTRVLPAGESLQPDHALPRAAVESSGSRAPRLSRAGSCRPLPSVYVGHTGTLGRCRLRGRVTPQRQEFTSGGSLYVGCGEACEDAARGLNCAGFDVCFDCTVTDAMLQWCRDFVPQALQANISGRPASRPAWPQGGRVLFEST